MLKIAKVLDDDNKQVDALLAQAEYHVETEHVRANEPAHQAAEIARGLDDPIREARALSLSGQANFFGGNLNQSRSDLEGASEKFLAAGLSGEAAASLHSLSLTLGNIGQNEAALEVGLRALDISREAGDKVPEATSLRRVAIAYENERRYEKALPFAQEALDLHRQLGDRAEEVSALNVLGIINSRLGNSERATGLYKDSINLAEEIESSVGIQYATFNNAWYTALEGQYERALSIVEEQVLKYADHPDRWLAGWLHNIQTIFYYLLGQHEKAIQSMERARALLEGIWNSNDQSGNQAFLAAIYAESGQGDKALESAKEAAKVAAQTSDGDFLFHNNWTARVHLILGEELETGLAMAEQAVADSRKYANDFIEIQSLNNKARLHLALNQPEAALTSVEDLLPLLDYLDANSRRQELMWTIYLVMSAVGREQEAKEALQDAYEYVQLISARTQDDDLRRSWLEKVPDNPRILAEIKKTELGH
jgi:tetratricopeptide (TPR) repeat protein